MDFSDCEALANSYDWSLSYRRTDEPHGLREDVTLRCHDGYGLIWACYNGGNVDYRDIYVKILELINRMTLPDGWDDERTTTQPLT